MKISDIMTEEFLRELRMGSRELAADPTYDFTLGFEFEVVVDADGYDGESDFDDAYERFSENFQYMTELEFLDDQGVRYWINQFNLVPKFGYVPVNVILQKEYEEDKETFVS